MYNLLKYLLYLVINPSNKSAETVDSSINYAVYNLTPFANRTEYFLQSPYF